jgi:mRNA interferase MazF
VKEGDIILTQIPQSDGTLKTRPALVLRELPPFRDLLVCGISTQTHQAVRGFDEVILRTDSDFSDTGLMSDSVARLGFLAVLPRSRFSTPLVITWTTEFLPGHLIYDSLQSLYISLFDLLVEGKPVITELKNDKSRSVRE